MGYPALTRYAECGVTLLGDTRRPRGVTLAFTERTGGVSAGPYSSLNLHDGLGDVPEAVRENRRRALAAMGAEVGPEAIVSPRQVHGDRLIYVTSERDARALRDAGEPEEADGVVCLTSGVPVLMCSADCALVVLVAPTTDGGGAFAIVHSGWRGTMARIAGKAAQSLVELTRCDPKDIDAYVGPHIGVDDFEVSRELACEFRAAFGDGVVSGERHVDLGHAIRATLTECGVRSERIVGVLESTASCTDRFFSYRASGGSCGRCGALAIIGV